MSISITIRLNTASDPAGSFKRLNEKCPVVYSERHGGFWIATGHREVTRIARDPVTFSTRPRPGLSGVSIPPFDNPVDSVPLEMDPPEFVPYRRLLLPLLSPRATEAMRPMIQYYADYLLDGVIEGGEMELIGEFANPAPSMVTLDWLGLPVGDWRRYADPFKFNNHASLAERARGKDGLKWVYGGGFTRRSLTGVNIRATTCSAILLTPTSMELWLPNTGRRAWPLC